MQRSELVGASIETSTTECGPLVVITFTGQGDLPGWNAQYVTDPLPSALDNIDVSLSGDATLQFGMLSWMGLLATGYQGPRDVVVTDVLGVRELRLVANADAVSSWAIGLDNELPFTVTEQQNPSRLEVQFYR